MVMVIFALFLVEAKWIVRVAAATVMAVSVFATQVTEAFAAGFAGSYAPANWTFINTGGSTDGTVDPSGAPSSIALTGGDSGFGGTGTTNYTVVVPISGTWSFDWSYSSADTDDNDIASFLLNGAPTFLADNASQGNGSTSMAVNASDTIGFRVFSLDNGQGSGVLTISNFLAPEAVPYEFSPSLGLLLLGVGWGAVNLRQFVKRRP